MKLTPTKKQDIITAYQSGQGSDTVAKQFNIHPNTVLKILKSAGISRRPLSVLTRDQIELMIQLYNNGLSPEKMSSQFNMTGTGIAKVLKREKIKLRTVSEAHRKYPINENFFDVIDSEDKAYLLGFMYADGCNQPNSNTSRIYLAELDKEILIKFSNLIYKNKQDIVSAIKTDDRTSEGKGVSVYINFNSKHMCSMLTKHGCVANKTFVITFPKLSSELERHFIRGYFDGDGTINNVDKPVSGCKLVSTKEMCEAIKERALALGGTCNFYKVNKQTDKNTYELYFSGNRNIQKFLHYIYKDATIYLERKYQKYLSFNEKMKEIDIKSAAGTQGYSKQYLQ